MRIGIDAKWYFNGHPSGKVVVENIVNHILEIDSSNNYFIYLDKKDKNLKFPYKNKNVKLIYIPNKVNAFTNFFILPFYTYKDRVDVCLYQNYSPLWGAKKIVNYVHDALFMDFPEYFSFLERLYFWPMKFLSKYADHVITISYSEKDRMIKHGFSKKENISVVHHGIGVASSVQYETPVDILKKYNLPSRFILYLGRLNIRKNIQTLLKALPSVDNDVSLVIVGKEDHKTSNWDQLIKELEITKRVFRVGHVPQVEIPHFYKLAELFCFPSYAEGFGLPPLESMHYGTPVVLSNTTSLPEVCGDAALYVSPDDSSALADKINSVLSDGDLKQTLIQKGFKQSSKFRWDRAASEILNILQS